MGQQYTELSDQLRNFIQQQKIFFVGTAAADGRVNVSPKGMDSLKVLSSRRVIWLNVTGSGNETSAHIQEDPRMTIMFAAFEGNPMILRLYGKAEVIHRGDPEWQALLAHLNPIPGARQIFDLDIDLVQTSCGKAVPIFDYIEDRDTLTNWANQRGEDGLKSYWEKKNRLSIDGKPTLIVEKNAE